MAKRGLQFLPQRGVTEVSPLGASVELGVGDILRLNRERRGLELQSVANQLRIRLAYLEAIEDGRYKDLPGSTYAVGFVRSYADYLELDGADIVRRFREEVARIHGRTRLIFPAITAEGTIPPAAILLLSVVAIGIGYGTWYYLSSTGQADVAAVQEVPDRLINAPESEVAPSAGSSQGAAAAPAPAATPTPPPAATPEPAPAPPSVEPQGAVDAPAADEQATTGSNLSTIMAPEPLPGATDGGSDTTDLVPPETSVETPPAPTATEAPPAAPAVETTAPSSISSATAPAAPGTAAPGTAAPADQAMAPAASDIAADASAATAPAVTAPATPTATAEAAPATQPPAATDGTSALPGATAESATPPQAPAAPSTTVPPTDSQTAASGATIPSAPALPAAPEPAEPAVTQQAAVPTSGGRIQINARLDTWIKITDRNGRSVLNRVLVAGESYTVPDEAGLKMITGNAGGMDILVDGTPIAPLGEPGKVRRDVELDPEKLKAGTAIPQ